MDPWLFVVDSLAIRFSMSPVSSLYPTGKDTDLQMLPHTLLVTAT
jgi:hypothetical protein